MATNALLRYENGNSLSEKNVTHEELQVRINKPPERFTCSQSNKLIVNLYKTVLMLMVSETMHL